MNIDEALSYLDGHVNLEATPPRAAARRRVDRIAAVLEAMGEPQHAYPVIHVTGTNGKGSTVRMIGALLGESGLRVGTYTSPHLQRVNERMSHGTEAISDDDLAAVLSSVAELEPLAAQGGLTHFEVLTAAALRWFADEAVDVAVVEVGLGGRLDATNVVSAQVAVVTNVALDHVASIGPTTADIAREKAGIIEADSTVVLGETDPDLVEVFAAEPSRAVWRRGSDFGCTAGTTAVGGQVVDLYVPGARYEQVFLGVHGRFQGDNAAAAVAAVAAFFDRPLDAEVVVSALGAVQVPGRVEVVGRHPLVVLDGAHNPAGAMAATRAIDESFLVTPDSNGSGAAPGPGRVLVVGMLRGRDPVEMLEALGASRAHVVVACPTPSPRSLPCAEVAAAARSLGCRAEEAASVAEAVDRALAVASPTDTVVVTGSLYVVGAARDRLVGQP